MKKVCDAKNVAEAQMIAHALSENGIEAEVRGEFDPLQEPSVWITDIKYYDKAMSIISEVIRLPEARQEVAGKQQYIKKSNFWPGLFMGIVLGVSIFYLSDSTDFLPWKKSTHEWDTNNDGKVDYWREAKTNGVAIETYDTNFDGKLDSWHYYKDSKVEKSIYDTNFDGKPDIWTFYNNQGMIEHNEQDADFDGRVDCWSYFNNGYLIEDACDNDRDGHKDEWGKYENSKIVERKWSYLNDNVIDKKAFYKSGRKFKEQYDLNRDGKFDETVLMDEFERVISKTKD